MPYWSDVPKIPSGSPIQPLSDNSGSLAVTYSSQPAIEVIRGEEVIAHARTVAYGLQQGKAVQYEVGYHYALVLSFLRNARFYRQCHSALGVGFQIHRQVPDCAQGAFEGLEHYLSVSHLTEASTGRMAA